MKRAGLCGFGWVLTGSVVATLLAGTCWAAQEGAGAVRAARAAVKTADRAAHAAEKGADRAARAAEKDADRAARVTAREEAGERTEAVKARREEAKDRLSDAASARVDARQENQGKRIQHGIAKGYLTTAEVTKLTTQQNSIAALESSLKSEGKLTRNEFQQLRTELNDASHCIWAEKHDTDGNRMPAYRLGKNVFAKGNLTSRLADENLGAADAKVLLKDFRRTVELRRKLATGDLSDAECAALQAEYDALLNTYFEVR